MDFRYSVLQVINSLVIKVPFIFSKKMVMIAYDFYDRNNRIETESFKQYEVIKTYSLLDPRLNWKMKAISSVCCLSAEQVNRLYKWKKNTDLRYHQSRSKTTINDNGWVNIGTFKTNINHKTYAHIPIGKDSDYIDSCSVYLCMYSNGVYYLSIYWFLTDKATCLVKDVDISKIKNREFKYSTCNPFSPLYGCTNQVNKVRQGDDVIISGLKAINKEIDLLEQSLMKVISVKKHSKPVRNIDIHVKENIPYFLNSEDLEKNDSDKLDSRYRLDEVAIDRTKSMFTTYDNYEKNEFLINYIPNISENPFNYIFVKSERLTEEEISDLFYYTYENMDCHIINSHNAFSIYQVFNQKFNEINDKYSDFILNNNAAPEKKYDAMYKAFIEIDELEIQIKNTISKRSIFNFENSEENYMNILFQDCSSALNRVREVKKDIEQKKKNSNELVQAENLKYQKRNSWLVILLALIQIALAYLAINDPQIKNLLSSLFPWIS